MIRTKDRFYWSDALYLARARNLLTFKESDKTSQIYQCAHCFSFVRFNTKTDGTATGHWSRIKPYEQFQLQKKYDQPMRTESLQELRRNSGRKKLFRCGTCASHWWQQDGGWDRADDEAVDKENEK